METRFMEVLNTTVAFMPMPAHAGFASPAEEFRVYPINLSEKLIQNPNSTFLMRASGDSMRGVGIFSGDVLIVDKSRTPLHNDIVVASLNNELVVKRLRCKGVPQLCSENPAYAPIIIGEMDVSVWGVVTYVIHDPKDA